MPEILQYGFMQRPLLAGVMIGTIAPAIGVFLVLRRLSLIADTLSHVALAGVAVGLLLGTYPLAGALVVTLLSALGIERLRVSGRLFGEAPLAIFLSPVLVAVTVVGAMRIVGILLTSALLVIPAVTALRLAPSFRSTLWVAVACSLFSVLAGMIAAFYLDIAAGGAIVLTSLGLFGAAAALGMGRGT